MLFLSIQQVNTNFYAKEKCRLAILLTGLLQPLIHYGEVCTQKVQLQRVLESLINLVSR